MRVLLVLMCLLVGSMALPSLTTASAEWKKFKALNRKVYKSAAEELMRLKLYLVNKVKVLAHNIKYRMKQVPYNVQLNKFGDLLDHEFKQAAGFNATLRQRTRSFNTYSYSGKPLPAAVDHRRFNLVNTPMQQGTCGSCWTFSTTGAIEGQLAYKTGKLIRLSQQHLLDCSNDNGGCSGGRPDKAFDYVRWSGGISTEASYPYTGVKSFCKAKPAYYAAKLSGFMNIQSGNSRDLADALANVGPVSVAIDSTSPMLKFYSSGVFAPPPNQCSSVKLDHAVLAIGYGNERGLNYWLIKNSWGTDWGEGGFVKIHNNGNNLCGVATVASFPILQL